MPIVSNEGKAFVLKCVNHAPGTMVRWEKKALLVNELQSAAPGRVSVFGYPVICFTCSICGYVELYDHDKVNLDGIPQGSRLVV